MQVGTPLDQVRTGPAVSQGKPLVVLLHGLMRGRKSMEKLRRCCEVAVASAAPAWGCSDHRELLHMCRQIQQETGWTAVSLQYPSTRQPIIKLAEGVASEVHELVSQGGHTSVWAVTHSLGGVLQRHIMGLPDQGALLVKPYPAHCKLHTFLVVLQTLSELCLTVLLQLCNSPQIGKSSCSQCLEVKLECFGQHANRSWIVSGGIIWSGIVMIAPPNQGSIVAHQMSNLPGIGKLFQYASPVSFTYKVLQYSAT